MFRNISWATYSVFITITAGIYYLIVINVFYKEKIAGVVNRLFHFNSRSDFEIANDENFDKDSPATIALLHNEIADHLERAKIRNSVKEEVVFSMRLILQKYDFLKESPVKDTINNYIKNAFENICSIHLDAEEIEGLWFR